MFAKQLVQQPFLRRWLLSHPFKEQVTMAVSNKMLNKANDADRFN